MDPNYPQYPLLNPFFVGYFILSPFVVRVDDRHLPITLKGKRSTTSYPLANFFPFVISPIYHNFAPSLSLSYEEALTHFVQVVTMEDEMSTLKSYGTWEITQLLDSKVNVRCKWMFTTKYSPNGCILRLKACLLQRTSLKLMVIIIMRRFPQLPD